MKSTLLACALFGAASLNAAVVANLQITGGTAYTGAGFIEGGPTDVWNTVNSGTDAIADLLGPDGSFTGISYTPAGFSDPASYGTNDSVSHPLYDATYIYSGGATVTFSGLAAGSYEVHIYTGLDGAYNYPFTFDANGVSGGVTYSESTALITPGVNFLVLSGVSPVSGDIVLTLGSEGAWGAGFSAVQIVSTIPEPSTYAALAGALALGLVAYRRRR